MLSGNFGSHPPVEPPLRVLVCGGRKYDNGIRLYGVLGKLHRTRGIAVVIQGGADGADTLAVKWAMANGVNTITYAAEWDKHGRAAGPKRNQAMVDRESPDLVVAFPGGRGTADMVRRARAAGIEVSEQT